VGRRPDEETATLGLYKLSHVRLSDNSHCWSLRRAWRWAIIDCLLVRLNLTSAVSSAYGELVDWNSPGPPRDRGIGSGRRGRCNG
jgi:hypothetical protein